jgi:hypothetical protein
MPFFIQPARKPCSNATETDKLYHLQSGLLAFPTGSSLPKPGNRFSGIIADSLYHCAMVGITAAGPRRICTVFPFKPFLVPVKIHLLLLVFLSPVNRNTAAHAVPVIKKSVRMLGTLTARRQPALR